MFNAFVKMKMSRRWKRISFSMSLIISMKESFSLKKFKAECSEAQKQEMIECIALFQAGQVEENEDESLKRALCFGRDETGKVIFYPEVFKMGPLDISHETLAGLKKSLIR